MRIVANVSTDHLFAGRPPQRKAYIFSKVSSGPERESTNFVFGFIGAFRNKRITNREGLRQMTNQRAEEIAARSRGGSFRDDTQRFHGALTFGYVERHREEAFRLAGRISLRAAPPTPPFGGA